MDTESLTVLIVAKTRRGGGACVGALTTEGRSVRLEAADTLGGEHANLEYEIGDVWQIEAAPHPRIVPPHVETVVVLRKRRLRRCNDLGGVIEKLMPPIEGSIDLLYDGLVQAADSGSLYIAERTGVPVRSTLFWRPDRPLKLVENGVRLHYCYESEAGERRLAFVGFQEPLAEIPAGAIVRVSLAHWWRPREHPQEEQRCYLQLSGWLLEAGSAVTHRQPHVDREIHEGAADVQVREVLKDTFGYDSFRPLQEEIIGALRRGRDTLAVMPTGAGKSLCYQLPALLWPGLTVVVSPLKSLMQDQVEALHTLGVAAAYFNSTLTYAEQRRLMDDVRAGEVKLLYLAPEMLVRAEVLHLLDQAGVDCLAVDEAHCISAWGHDFRPEYRQLEPVRRRYPSAVCLAMTATAAPRVRADIKQSLGIADAGEVVASFDRPNLFLAAQPRTDGERQLLSFLAEHRTQSGIIYCTARAQVETLAARLQRHGYSALPYHAGLDDLTRQKNQRAFTRDEAQIIVATVAFGMGINKSNVRFVIHYNMPASLEAYYQEIGRSGRDGLRADCLLLYSMQDVQAHARMIDDGVEEERAGRNARLQAMLRFAEAHACRRPPLLRYFGEQAPDAACGFCDNCATEAGERPQEDVTPAARKFFTCVLRTGEMYGTGHIVDILRGSQSRKILERRQNLLDAYGAGKEHSTAEWRALAQQWIQQRLLEQDMEHGGLRLTAWGREVLAGQRQAYAEPRGVKRESRRETAQGSRAAVLPEYDQGMFEHLRGLRRQLADAANLPPYMVFSDRALAEMAAYLPRTSEEFTAINGVGRAKLASYGEVFLGAIAAYAGEHGLQPQARLPIQAQSQAALPAFGQPLTAAGGSGGRATRRSHRLGEMFQGGATLAMLQETAGIKRSTVISHLRDHLASGGELDSARLRGECALPAETQGEVLAQFGRLGAERLTPVYEALQGRADYEELHLLRLVWLVERPPA